MILFCCRALHERNRLETAARLVRDAGFGPVIVGELARGKEFEPGTRPYNTGMSGPELRNISNRIHFVVPDFGQFMGVVWMILLHPNMHQAPSHPIFSRFLWELELQ